MRTRVTITYLCPRLNRSRYGYVQRQETVSRYVDHAELDSLLEQFRSDYTVVEVKIARVP